VNRKQGAQPDGNGVGREKDAPGCEFGDLRVSSRSGWFSPAFVTAGIADGAAGFQDDLL